MKTHIFFLPALTGILFGGSCTKDNPDPAVNLTPKNIELTAGAPQLIQTNNAFGVELFREVASAENKNLMISPLSAGTALTMLLNGCGGDTYDQVKTTLKYPDDMTLSQINEAWGLLTGQLLEADPKVTLALANAIFYREGFTVKEPFLNTMSHDYSAQVGALDFSHPSALETINQWASDHTNGKIPEVLDEISAEAVMFLMNALYFKGDWSYQFDKALTEDRPFYPDTGEAFDVPTMNGEAGAKVVYGDQYQAIELPYGRTNFTMVAVVPGGSLEEFIASFTPEVWNEITGGMDGQTDYADTEVFMPKFKFSYEKFLNDQLISMGMIDAFDPFAADLSGISDTRIYVDFVKQNTFVDVNEEGTEAAAVTTIGVNLTSMPPQPQVFRIDKPFVFAIRERTTNTLLFMGQVVAPPYE
ncbi:MAG: serpin family protein [Bacteroidales bacterium]